ncbi:MAG: DUF885 family protein, partial [Myxococcota bacterium]
MHRSIIIPLALCAAAATACATPGPASAPTTAAVASADPVAEAKKLDSFLEEYFEASLKMSPIQATFIGDQRYNYLLPNFLSPAAQTASEAFAKHWLSRIQTEIDRDALRGQARLSFDVFVSQRKNDIEGMAFPGELQPITQFFSIPSFLAQLGSGQSVQPFKTVKNYEDWLLRLDSAAILFDQSIVNMKEGIRRKVVQPKIVVQKAIPQIAAHVVDDVEKSLFWMPIKKMPESFSA